MGLYSGCKGVYLEDGVAKAVEEFLQSFIAAVDNPRLIYILTPHWGSRLVVNPMDGDVSPLQTLYRGSGVAKNPLLMEFRGSIIEMRRSYRRAVEEGFDSLVFTNAPPYAPLFLGNLTMAEAGKPTALPVFRVVNRKDALGPFNYSVDYRVVEEVYHDLVVVKYGDVEESLVIGVNAGSIFVGKDACKLIEWIRGLISRIVSDEYRLSYIVHVAINDEWGNPRNPPLYLGFSTSLFIRDTLRRFIDRPPLMYMYVDSMGQANYIYAPGEVSSIMQTTILNEPPIETAGILPDHYGYWSLLVKGANVGFSPGEVDSIISHVIRLFEEGPSETLRRIGSAFSDTLKPILSKFGLDDLLTRAGPEELGLIKGILMKYIYDRDRDSVNRVNLLEPGDRHSMIDIATGTVYLDSPEGSLADSMNLKLMLLDEIKGILLR